MESSNSNNSNNNLKPFGDLVKTFETTEPEIRNNAEREKPDLKKQILTRFPKLTEEQYNLFLLLKEDTDNAITKTVKNKENSFLL